MHEYLFILSGGLIKDKSGHWHTTLGEEGMEDGLILNDHLRILAGAQLWQENEDLEIIVSGGLGKLRGVLPNNLTISKVMKNELVELGVPAEKIIEDETTSSTYGQLQSLSEMIKSVKLSGKVSIISNTYHLPRIQAMIEYTELIKILTPISVSLLGAEDVLLRLKPKEWRDFIEKVSKTDGMKKRIISESRGVMAIKNGTYEFN